MSVPVTVFTFHTLESPVVSQLVCGLVMHGGWVTWPLLFQGRQMMGIPLGSEVTEVGLCCLTGRQAWSLHPEGLRKNALTVLLI